jgi:hypothetical protein
MADLNPFEHLFADVTVSEPSPPETNARPSNSSTLVLVVIALIVAIGAVFPIAIQRMHFPNAHDPWIGLLLFVGLVVLAHRYAADLDGRGTTSVAVVPMIGAALLFNG